MKRMIQCAVSFLLLLTLHFPLTSARAQGTAFTYQGSLNSGGSPANGLFDFRFRLDADPVGNTILSTVLTNSIGVTNGLFTTTIDFGAGWFNGSNYWLEVDVKTNSFATYTTLNPLQQLTPAPYAVMANSASNLLGVLPAGQLSGAIANNNLPANPNFSGTVTAGFFSGNGANLTSLNANNLSSGTVPLARLPGAVVTNNQTGVILGGTFSGNGSGLTTLNASQLTSGVVPQGVLPGFQAPFYSTIGGGIQNTSSASYSVVGGGTQNTASGGESTVGGGNVNTASGTDSTVGGGYNNTAGNFSTVGGGYQNSASGNLFGDATVAGGTGNQVTGDFASIGGGQNNTNSGNFGTVGGGSVNLIDASGDHSAIGGGFGNHVVGYESTISGGYFNLINGQDDVIAGGDLNVINLGANQSFIGGGINNTNTGSLAIILGGDHNVATNNSFAAGHRAKAINQGAFVWADSQDTDFSSTATNQFNVRANGGVRLVTSGAGMTLDGQPVFAGSNGSGLTNLSASQLTSLSSTNGLGGPTGNFFVGPSGNATTSGGANTSLGYGALLTNTSASYNTAVGEFALTSNTSGGENTAIGASALGYNTIGYYNTAIGKEALYKNTNGFYNTASGWRALFGNTNGGANTGDGAEALANNVSGSDNTASGAAALGLLGSANGAGGTNNIALGYFAGSAFTGNESSNIDIGSPGIVGDNKIVRIGTPGIHTQTYLAGVINGNGSGLTNLNATQLASGTIPLAQLPSAVVTNNETGVTLAGTFSGTGNGLASLNASQLTSGTVPLGRLPAAVLTNNQTAAVTLSNLTLTGTLTLPGSAPGVGVQAAIKSGTSLFIFADTNDSFFAGVDAGNTLVTGAANAGFGGSSLGALTSGAYNSAGGFGALRNLQTGYENTALGLDALQDLVSGSNNVAIGGAALAFSGSLTGGGGSSNIAIGQLAAQNYQYNESGNIIIGNDGVPFDENVIRIGTPGSHTSAFIAGVVTDVGGVQVGTNGTTMSFIQSGQAIMPSSSLVLTNFTVTFPHAFTATPKVIASISGDPGFASASDTFAMSIRALTTTTGFTVNVMRVDSASGWSQQLRINWQAWQ